LRAIVAVEEGAARITLKWRGKVDNIEYENIENLTSKKWIKIRELNLPKISSPLSTVTHNQIL